MASSNFSTSNQTYRQLMGNGLTYSVPRFQRDYSWEDVEWEDLWSDILSLFSSQEEQMHYMGYLVLQSRDSQNFDIIDGQQRLTTLSLLVLAVLANLDRLAKGSSQEAADNKRRSEQLRQQFIGYLDPVTLIPRSKLTLNRNNDSLYQNYLVPITPAPKRNLKKTEHKMRKAFEWFERHVREHYDNGPELAKLVSEIASRLFFTVITVDDELNAYKVFETLNARGVKLSSTDLLKNYLFSVVHRSTENDHELLVLEHRWDGIVDKLGSESFPTFLRAHWNSRYTFVRQAELFKRIRDKVRDREQVFRMIRDMEEDADIYSALSHPEDSLWREEKKQRLYVRNLKMFKVSQAYPLLMAAYRIFSEKSASKFTELLKAINVISFRYNVIGGKPTNEQERTYHAVAERLANGTIDNLKPVWRELKKLYPNDERFQADFTEKRLRTRDSRNKKVARYILFELESKVTGMPHDFESDTTTIEHVLPEKPEEGWTAFDDAMHEDFLYRLGNMTLLHVSANISEGNAPFTSKAAAYGQSAYAITRRIHEHYQSWTPEKIASHQQWMAKQATAIWRMDQLSRNAETP